MNKSGERHAWAVLILVVLALVTLASAQDASAAPQSSPPLSDVPSLTPVSLIPSLSMAPSPLASIGAPTVTAPTRTYDSPQPIPTESISSSPMAAVTTPPTGPVVSADGLVYITLFYVADEVPEQYVEAYERQCAAFFTKQLSTLTNPISGITCSLLEQDVLPNESEARLRGRGLQADMSRLLTLMNVQGSISAAAGSPNDMNLILRFAVLNDPEGFAKTLREATDTGLYFNSVETVDAFDPETFTPYPTVAPPGGQPVGQPAEDDKALEAAGIVAIVIGILAAAIIASVVTYCVVTKGQANPVGAATPKREKDSESVKAQQEVPDAVVESVPAKGSPSTTATTTEDAPPVAEEKIPVPAARDAPIPVPVNGGVLAAAEEDKSVAKEDEAPVAQENNDILQMEEEDIPETKDTLFPDTKDDDIVFEADDDDDFPAVASTSVMESDGADALSYAYSLDAGNVDSQTGERVGESTVGGDLSTEVSIRPNMTSREVIAPPGKLGIVIDTTLEGPVVHKVNPGSPLEEKVYPGDIIVAIDDVDTRAMSASAITALMVKTANQERRLTVLSEETPSEP